jgi:DNA polymerase-3 subunit gamma/tau
MSLYLKYRPQKFAHLVGQDHIRVTLQNAIKKAQVSHAYLFCGPRGTGKTSSARLIAKAINCPNFDAKGIEPCDSCDVCEAINAGRLIDIIEIDAASNRGIDEIRELKETIKFAPTQVANKVYIIDEVHMLTNEAFNALLKTLEEPPDNVYFILATTEVHKIPDTIISRCQRFDFRRMTDKTIEARLAFIAQSENIEIEAGVLDMIARQVDGGLRDAIGLLEQLNIDGKLTLENAQALIGSTGTDVVSSFYEHLISRDEKNSIAVVQNIYSSGHDIGQFKKDFVMYLRDKLHEAIDTNNVQSQSEIIKLIETWHTVIDNFTNVLIPQLPIEVFVVKVCLGSEVSKSSPNKRVAKTETKKAEPKIVKEEVIVERAPEVETKIQEVVVERAPEVETKIQEVVVEESDEIQKVEEVNETEAPQMSKVLEKEWVNVIKNINKSTLKRSLQQSILRPGAENTYEIVFNSDFYFRTVNNAESISIIEEVVKDIFKKTIKLKAVKEDISITPAKIDPQPPKPVFNDDIVMEAMDMFEGEFID